MEYVTTAKYIRMSPRKVRLLADSIRGRESNTVLSQLESIHQPVAKLFITTLTSAVANAKLKNADIQSLWVKSIDVMEGPVFKRWHAVSRGMAHSYKKRMAHIRLILSDEKKGEKK
ncbi:hypothetical protein A3A79_03815 [Candidatus Gottesmanbacteria bacterium RIFCSPLOWO2_01_FULL_43_11b]|uniref:Large ribosomal subunit protein uL22 n=1 Tax=Candidatus Gottesmanbacteria bacterium RIFCSPLOWO2_01_FULL_43_11b TaxID=1798392 RepID=A0A1F6AI51_9BACT|nr:MAG: hypothetical protein A3A79_03815 [Candidatus Gottesmanbacteria bacterium RIFCSPLOWO2_01_FULL_43_11b]